MSLCLYWFLVKMGINYIFASSISYVFGVIEGYVLHSIFVFKKTLAIKAFCKYSSVYIVSFFVNIIFLYVLVDIFHINKFVSPVICSAIITIVNYIMIKIFVF